MIKISDKDGIKVATMCHNKANAMDLDFLIAIEKCIEQLIDEGHPTTILTGEGQIFSAGVDLVKLIDGGPHYIKDFIIQLDKTLLSVFKYPGPIIAAINGHAIAGGCVLACCCDSRMTTNHDGKIGVPELLVGVPFPPVALQSVTRLINGYHFQDLIYNGRLLNMTQAHKMGLIDEIVEPENLLPGAVKKAKQWNTIPSQSFALTKSKNIQPILDLINDQNKKYMSSLIKIWTSEEVLSKVKQYVAKTLQK